MIKKTLLVIYLTSIINICYAQSTYYVSSSVGNDSNDGLSESTPWKSIGKINQLDLVPGDQVLFKRDDSWNDGEGLLIKDSGSQGNEIIIGSYGTGEKPIISILSELKDWKNQNSWEYYKPNVWRIIRSGELSKKPVVRMWMDNVQYKTAETVDIKWEDLKIPRSTYGIDEEYRFFSNYDNYLYIYSPTNPSDYYSSIIVNFNENVRNVFSIENADYIIIKDLDLRGGHSTIAVSASKYCIIDNCDIGFSSFRAVFFLAESGIYTENCVIKNSKIEGNFDSIYGGWYDFYSYDYSVTSSFLTVNIGVEFGDGTKYCKAFNNEIIDFHFAGVRFMGKNYSCQYNEAYDNIIDCSGIPTGRMAHMISYSPSPGIVSHNRFYRNHSINTGLNFEIGGDNNYVYYNIMDGSKTTIPRIYTLQGVGMSIDAGDPNGICKNNFIFNNTLYNLNDDPITDWGDNNLIANNLIIESGIGIDNLKIEKNRYTKVLNNCIYHSATTPNDHVLYYDGKTMSISEFNSVDNNSNNQFNNNIHYTNSVKRLINDPQNDKFQIVKGSLISSAGIDISDYVEVGFKDIYGTDVNLRSPNIGASEAVIDLGNIEGLDSDNDGIPDSIDLCPLEPETYNGYQDEDGCPDDTSEISNSKIKIFLEGPYSGSTMSTDLNKNGLLPGRHPYNVSPWDHSGSESVTSFSENVIDWILISLRDDFNQIFSKAVLLLKDGYIVNASDEKPITFDGVPDGMYYLVVKHRNHLPAVSTSKVELADESMTYDFTIEPSSSLTLLANGTYGIIAGDSDANYIINNKDYESVGSNIFNSGYRREDIDLNGVINVLDYKLIYKNQNKSSEGL